jgi:uncharacterized protein
VELRDGRLFFSPSDVSDFVACEHLTSLQLEVARGLREKPYRENPQGDLVREKGEEHEAAYLEWLRSQGRDVVCIERGEYPYDWDAGARQTEEAMRAGADVVYQAVLRGDRWRGLADFLERVEEESELGPWSYEAVDTKLARRPKPHYVLQLGFYSEGIARIQGRFPERMHVVLGTGVRETFRPAEFAAYLRRVRAGFQSAVAGGQDTYPYPVDHCVICDFAGVCHARWDADDHLVRVARIRRDQVERLGSAGISTLAGLGRAAADTVVPKLAPPTFATLRRQAALQLEARETGLLPFELLGVEPGRGLARLPQPTPGDVFFDIEGHPFYEPGRSLEYLFGLVYEEGGQRVFRPLWAHDRDGEKRMLEALVDFLHERLRRWPALHVYHYGTYDAAAVKRLMGEYATREHEVDDLLRREVFVNLHTVVTQALQAGVASYSLKEIERLYGFERRADVSSGGESFLAYEEWTTSREQRLLDDIAAYNEEDCRATAALRDWLVGLRPSGLEWAELPEPPGLPEEAETRARLRHELVDGAELGSVRRLAGELLDYHRREARPAWWWFFDRLQRSPEELVGDPESIGLLEPDPHVPVEPDAQSTIHALRFPVQDFRLGPGDDPVDVHTGKGAGTIVEIDGAAGWLRLRRGPSLADVPLPRALIPQGPYRTDAQQDALNRLAESVRDGDGRFSALESILAGAPPRAGQPAGASIQTTDVGEIARLALSLDRSHLFVQGPPGSGKTYTGARVLVRLMQAGRRVGVSATSHKAIHNLLAEAERAAAEAGLRFRGLKKCSGDEESRYESPMIDSEPRNAVFADLEPGVLLIAGTAWLFARADMQGSVDVLAIDEAGQVSLADALAMGTAARNVVLLGDPLQLAQVSQGTHPEGTGASVLEHLLGEEPTIPESRGVFLEHSWRMHPDVCAFVSEVVYAGRLDSAEQCRRQGTAFGTGIRFLPVEHVGNRRESSEEVEAVAREIGRMLGGNYTDSKGVTRALRPDDFMVVTPYNAQVRALLAGLPEKVRVGTVDKFQGQEAPVVFFSMATSSGEDVPRNLEFLFSRNRLNVAVSRARCLAILVCSPRLLEARARTVDQMLLVNALCRLVEVAEQQTA